MTRGETLYAARVLRWIQCWTRQIARHHAQRPSWSLRPPDVVPRGLEAGGGLLEENKLKILHSRFSVEKIMESLWAQIPGHLN